MKAAKPTAAEPPLTAELADAVRDKSLSRTARLRNATSAANCSPQNSKACMALARQNAALTKKLEELEGKITVLQAALAPGAGMAAAHGDAPAAPSASEAHGAAPSAGAGHGAAPAASSPHGAAPAEGAHGASSSAIAPHGEAPAAEKTPHGVSSSAGATPAAEAAHAEAPKPKVKLVPVRAKVKTATPEVKKPEESGLKATTWRGIGTAVVLALIAGGVILLRRRKNKSATPKVPSKYWVLLKHPFRRKKKTALLEDIGGPATEPHPVAGDAERQEPA